MTFVTRASGFVARRLARVVRGGKPVPPDLEPYVDRMDDYSQLLMVHSWSMQRAKPTPAQLKVRRCLWHGPDPAPAQPESQPRL